MNSGQDAARTGTKPCRIGAIPMRDPRARDESATRVNSITVGLSESTSVRTATAVIGSPFVDGAQREGGYFAYVYTEYRHIDHSIM